MPPAKRPLEDPDTDLFEQHEATIRQLYQDEKKTASEVKHIMEDQHGFPDIPVSTYQTKLRDELRLRKNLKKGEWGAVYQHCKMREGKETGIYINGTRKPWKSAWKEMRRSGAREVDQGQHMPLPAYVSVRTPSPVGFPLPMPNLASQGPPSDMASASLVDPHPIPSMAQIRESPAYDFPNLAEGSGQAILPFVRGQEELVSSPQVYVHTPKELGRVCHSHNGSSMILASQVAKFTAFLIPALTKWSWSLQETPWNMLRRELFTIASNKSRDAGTYGAVLNRMAHQFNPDLPELWRISYPSVFFSFFDPKPSPTTLALNFDVLNYISRAIYLVSNNLINGNICNKRIPDILKILLDQLPKMDLFGLLQNDIPTMRALWEILIRCAGRYRLDGAFHILMKVGFQHHSWILSSGHTCLSFAASMNNHTLVRSLLELGIRPDDSFNSDMWSSPYPAVIEAAAAGSIECLEMLVTNCDINRVILYSDSTREGASTFEILLACLTRPGWRFQEPFFLHEEPQNLVLSLLESGADVDKVHGYGSDNHDLRILYRYEGIPENLWPMIFERMYHWGNLNLYRTLAQYSRKLHITRPGICTSAKQGRSAIYEYIQSQPARDDIDTARFLELVLAEQFFVRGLNIDLNVVHGLIEFGVNPTLPSLKLDVGVLLSRLVAQASQYGIDDKLPAILALLIKSGAVIDSNPLAAAVERRKGVGVLSLLAQYDADIKNHGLEALRQSACLENYEAVSWLLDAGVDINGEIQTSSGPASIIAASSLCCTSLSMLPGDLPTSHFGYSGPASYEMTRYLIQRGARLTHSPRDLNSFNFMYWYLVQFTAYPPSLNIMKLFLDVRSGCNDLSDPEKCILEACLLEACFAFLEGDPNTKARLEIFELLLRRGAPVKYSRALPLLIHYRGRHDLILEMLEAGVDVNAYSRGFGAGSFQVTAAQAAAWNGDLPLVALLMSKGADINLPTIGPRGRTVLQAACGWDPLTAEENAKKLSLVQFLLEHGADVNAPAEDDRGQTALQLAAAHGDMEIAALLLHHGANPNAPGSWGTALDGAAEMGRIDMVQFLLNVGALSQDQGETGYDGAIRLAERERFQAIAELIRQNVKNDIMLVGGNLALTF